MSKTNLKLQTQYDAATTMDSAFPQSATQESAALPLSKRINSMFSEFVTGMRLAQHHHENQQFGLDVLASHNLRLLEKRLEQISEYRQILQQSKRGISENDALWTCLYEDNDVTCGLMRLKPNLDIPFYSHPGLHSMCLVLSGRAEVKYYALSRHQEGEEERQEQGNTRFKLLSYHGVSESDAVYCQSGSNSLTNLSTGEDACLLLNIQLSSSVMTGAERTIQ